MIFIEYLMECGHISNAHDEFGNPVCAICCGHKDGYDRIKAVCKGTEGLENRMAICCQHDGESKPVPSRWNLPLFEYKPNEKYDSYYCGCHGWD